MFDNMWAWLAAIVAIGGIGGIGVGIWLLGGAGLLAWFMASKVGKWIAIIGGAVLGVLLIVAKIFSAGQAKERARQKEESAKAIKARAEKDAEVSRLTPTERRKRLKTWTRD